MPERVQYSPQEMMTIQAAREITDEDIVFCGTGISMLAALAPELPLASSPEASEWW